MTVLDAYAVLAYLRGETAAAEVAGLLRGRTVLSAANAAEVIDQLVRVHGREADDVHADLALLAHAGLEIAPVTESLGLHAGRLRARCYHPQRMPVSLADCIAAATALEQRRPLATSDPALAELVRAEAGEVHGLPDRNGRLPQGCPDLPAAMDQAPLHGLVLYSTGRITSVTPEEWIAHDPDPDDAAELSACAPDELAKRFSGSLTFGTAGLRGPMRAGPNGMNVAVVLRATWALARVLRDRSQVVVGYDARHSSREFATAAAEVLAAAGFSVTLFPEPLPTPVLAFAVRQTGAAAGVQITASHNPATDNGYKVYLDGGLQIVSPTDREIEAAIATAPYADEIDRTPVTPGGSDILEHYLDRVAAVRRSRGTVRVALTPLHGVGGAIAVEALRRAGFTDIQTVASQFAPDPDFPTVAFPNPEEPGAVDALLELAARVDADIAVALDPDADRCAIGIPIDGGWRMLSGDETGWLLGDYILQYAGPGVVVASTVVSSRMLASIAAAHGARHVETLTGFKWLARASGDDLVYAYEEAIGHCVDPEAVRDKDGISAAVLCCDLAATLKAAGRRIPALLDDLARRHGVHQTASIIVRTDDAGAVMSRLRDNPPTQLAGLDVTVTGRADVLVFTGDGVRLAVRPSGTEPKVKGYIEIRVPTDNDLAAARRSAQSLCEGVRREAGTLLGSRDRLNR